MNHLPEIEARKERALEAFETVSSIAERRIDAGVANVVERIKLVVPEAPPVLTLITGELEQTNQPVEAAEVMPPYHEVETARTNVAAAYEAPLEEQQEIIHLDSHRVLPSQEQEGHDDYQESA